MTVALVWTLLVWPPINNSAPPSAIDGFPTLEHCRAMGRVVQAETPGFVAPKMRCIQRQMVVAAK